MWKRLSRCGAAIAVALFALWGHGAAAQAAACPFAHQKPMLIVQLFFGQSIKGRGPVTPREWATFLGQTVTPLLADGFTVFDATGQWRDPRTQAIRHDKTKVIVVAAEHSPAVRAHVDELTAAYRVRFHQQSVGIVTNAGCGAF